MLRRCSPLSLPTTGRQASDGLREAQVVSALPSVGCRVGPATRPGGSQPVRGAKVGGGWRTVLPRSISPRGDECAGVWRGCVGRAGVSPACGPRGRRRGAGVCGA